MSAAGVEESGGTVSFDEVFNCFAAELESRLVMLRNLYLALDDDERAALIHKR